MGYQNWERDQSLESGENLKFKKPEGNVMCLQTEGGVRVKEGCAARI